MKRNLFVCAFFISVNLAAQSPYLIHDINENGAPSNPRGLVTIGSITYFYADDGIHGRELWRSDGTEDGTYLVKDINPGKGHGFFDDTFDEYTVLIPVGEMLYIIADDGTHSFELWKSDGTEAGTSLVKDINPDGVGVSGTGSFVEFNGKLYFTAGESNQQELWVSDGSEAGTQMVEGANALSTGSKTPNMLTVCNGNLFFKAATQNDDQLQLWKYDGVSTSLVFDTKPDKMTCSSATLFFTTDDGIHGNELWKTNGTTTGTTMVKDIYSGNDNTVNPQFLTDALGALYFIHQDDQLWRTDGTESGTVMVKDIQTSENSWSALLYLVSNGSAIFSIEYGGYGETHIWKSDGTEAGTTKVTKNGSYYDVANLTAVGSDVYFTNWGELWKVDNNDNSSSLVKESLFQDFYGMRIRLVGNQGLLLFAASGSEFGSELWGSDGTETGTRIIKNVNEGGLGSRFTSLVTNGDRIAFGGGIQLDQLWLTDGSQADSLSSSFSVSNYVGTDMISVDGTLYLSATDFSVNYQNELFKISPGDVKPVLVKDLNGTSSSYPESLTEVNGSLFFVAEEGGKQALWKSDGTNAGTSRIKEITPARVRWPRFYDYKNIDNKLFFAAEDEQHGIELWVSNGTETGTHMVKEINSGTNQYGKAGSYPGYLTEFMNTVFFQAFDGTDHELWKSDGTAEGTVKVTSSNVTPAYLTVMNDQLFFIGHNNNEQAALWVSDGTQAGTKVLFSKEGLVNKYGTVKSHQTPIYYDNLMVGGDLLYFTINDGEHGRELWKSDGTVAGTQLVKDINPSGSSEPANFFYTHERLYFSADDGIHGQELWVTDGSAKGTKLVSDIHSGWSDSNPGNMTILGDLLVFNATNRLGEELWAYNITKAKLAQTITFADLADHRVGDTITLAATASSGLPISYAVEGPALLSGNLLVFTGEGEVTVTASQGGDDSFDPAEAVVRRSQATDPVPEEEVAEPETEEENTMEPEEEVITSIETDITSAIVAHPNPTKGRVLLSATDPAWQGSTVYISTAIGYQISQARMVGTQLLIDLRSYPTGLYVIRIEQKDRTQTLKVMKR